MYVICILFLLADGYALSDCPDAESTQLDTTSSNMDTDDADDTPVPDISTRPGFPDLHTEDVIEDASLLDVPGEGEELCVTYELIEGATRGGNTLLVDSLGYTYNKKALGRKRHQESAKCTWRCSVRSRALSCPAVISQHGSVFTPGSRIHVHPAQPDAAVKAKVTTKVKVMAKEKSNVFKSAACIVDDAIAQVEGSNSACPNPAYLARTANRVRQKGRPAEPKTLDFNLKTEFIPTDFLQKDIKMDDARHIVFATRQQLNLLENAKTWYVDATFKVVRKPFVQLLGIHAFVKGDNKNVKQVPLTFVLMSSRRKKDYKKVFKCVCSLLPQRKVEKFVMDFEIALWQAVRATLPASCIQGCAFHWNQAIWRKVQSLGLAVPYVSHRPTQDFIKQVMALPFLPEDHITTTFGHLEERAPDGPCSQFMSYVRETWLSGHWTPQDWSVYGQNIRTNNDVEGYHRRLNGKAGGAHIPLYVLIPILHREAEHVNIQVRLVKDGKLARYQRRAYRTQQGKIFSLWQKYEEHDITTQQLLRACAKLTGPTE